MFFWIALPAVLVAAMAVFFLGSRGVEGRFRTEHHYKHDPESGVDEGTPAED